MSEYVNIGRRDRKTITHQGQTLGLYQWAKKLGIHYETLRVRINVLGWDAERALTVPKGTARTSRPRRPYTKLYKFTLPILVDIMGKRFGRLLVVGLAGKPEGSPQYKFECLCDCGIFRSVNWTSLQNGSTRSCGCLNRELTKQRCTTHGKSHTKEWQILHQIKARCTNPNNVSWDRYGGRGIKVCQRWLDSYDDFFADVGHRPSNRHSLDRINNDGNYEPGNVRWATMVEQSRNTRRNKMYEWKGNSYCVTDLADAVGMPRMRLASRLRAGWALERAINQPRVGGELD